MQVKRGLLVGAGIAICWHGCGGRTDTTARGSTSDSETPDSALEVGAGDVSVDDDSPSEEEACACFVATGLVSSKMGEHCPGWVTDECLACYEQVVDGQSCHGLDLSDVARCLHPCQGVTTPFDSSDCIIVTSALLDEPEAEAAAACLCENCGEQFADCLRSPWCWSVVTCASQTGCYHDACRDDPVCAPAVVSAEAGWRGTMSNVMRVANCDVGHACSGLCSPYSEACHLEKMAFNQQTGCANDGSLEFCIEATDNELLARVQAIEPDVQCSAGIPGRAQCQDTQLYCAFPTGPENCAAPHGGMSDESWQRICEISALSGIERIVHTIYL